MPWQWNGGPAVPQSRAWDEGGNVQPTRAEFVAFRGETKSPATWPQFPSHHYNAVATWAVDSTVERPMFAPRSAVNIIALVALFAAPAVAKGPNLRQLISQADLAPWDLTIMPDGTGLPAGSGTPAQGKELFAADCAICHGDNGRGRNRRGGRGGQPSAAERTGIDQVDR
jgi:mono/diheme cytochrome c family protein